MRLPTMLAIATRAYVRFEDFCVPEVCTWLRLLVIDKAVNPSLVPGSIGKTVGSSSRMNTCTAEGSKGAVPAGSIARGDATLVSPSDRGLAVAQMQV